MLIILCKAVTLFKEKIILINDNLQKVEIEKT